MLTLQNIPLNDKNTILFLSNPKNNKALFQYRSGVSQKYLKATFPVLNKKFNENRGRIKNSIKSFGVEKEKELSEILKEVDYDESTDVISLCAIIQTIIRPSSRNSGTSERLIKKMTGKKDKDTELPISNQTSLYKIFCKHTKDTYNECIYQEQFMLILNDIFKLDNLGLADVYRRYFENKKSSKEKLNELKNIMWNLYKNTESVNDIKDFWHFLETLGEYGFNKSHAIGYAQLSYYTAYMLANIPKYYLATCINRCVDDSRQKGWEKKEDLVLDARDLGVNVLLPIVNKSFNKPTPDKDKDIIFLSADIVSGIGENIAEALASKNDFNSLKEFLNWSSKYKKFLTDSETGFIKEMKLFNKLHYELLTEIGFFKPFFENKNFSEYYEECIDYINSFSIEFIEQKEKEFSKKHNKHIYKLKDNKTLKEELYKDYELFCEVKVLTPLLKEKIEKKTKVNKYKSEYELLKFILSDVFDDYKDDDLNKENSKFIKYKGDNKEIQEGYSVFMVKKVSIGKSKLKIPDQLDIYTKITGINSNNKLPNSFYINGANLLSKYKYGDIIYIKYHLIDEKFKYQNSELMKRLI